MKPNDGPSFGIFSILLFHHTMILLLQSFRAASELDCSHQPIVALAGDDVILQCQLQPAVDASSETLMWTRPGLDPKYIHVHHDGRPILVNQNPDFNLRTALFVDQLMNGNVSLKLLRVKLSDAGQYHCIIDSKQREASVQLIVGAASTPVVNIAGHDRFKGAVVLQCESTGWYPEPEVFWLDAEGNLLSAGPTETVRGPDDLYTVSSRVTVEKRHSNSFTCRVQQKKTNQIRETLIHVPDDFFAGPSGSGSSLPVIIGVILSIVFVLGVAAVVVVWKWRQNKIRNKKHQEDEERRKHPEQELLMGPETDRKQPTGETDTVHNVDEFRAETGLQTETETETGLDKSQEETETEAVTETASLNPVSTNLNNTEETQTGTMMEERQKDNNLQTEEEEEKIKCAGDETGAQSLTEEDKHGEQQTAERETLRDREEENLKKKLKTKEREEEAFEKQLSKYEGRIKDREKQINGVKQQLEEVERQTEEAERRMRSVKKEDKDDLKRKKEELQEQLEKLETQLEGTKKSEIVATQKKLKATTEKQEIIMKLKELETQRNQRSHSEDGGTVK